MLRLLNLHGGHIDICHNILCLCRMLKTFHANVKEKQKNTNTLPVCLNKRMRTKVLGISLNSYTSCVIRFEHELYSHVQAYNLIIVTVKK